MPGTYMRLLPAMLLGSALPIHGVAVAAEISYPQRPVTLVVGYAPGGAADKLARLLAGYLTDDLGHSVRVENRSGATSGIAAEYVARSVPDGHTVFLASTANTINQTLRAGGNYDVVADFAPVGMVASTANMLVVHPDVPARNLQEFIAHAQAHPGRLTCASSGSGSTTHLSCELFGMATGTEILHVPYRGSAPALTDLLAGHVTCMFDNLPTSLAHVESGKLRALGVTTPNRNPLAPDIPSLAEAGLPGFSVESWFGLLAPAGTHPKVIDRLNQALRRALGTAELRHAFARNGYMTPVEPATAPAFGALIALEVEKWGAVVSAAGLAPE